MAGRNHSLSQLSTLSFAMSELQKIQVSRKGHELPS